LNFIYLKEVKKKFFDLKTKKMKILFVLSLILIISQLVNLSDSFYIDQDNNDLQENRRQASGKFKATTL